MKIISIFLIAVCEFTLTVAVHAQGTVSWSLISPAAMTAQTNSTQFYNGGSTGGLGSVGATAASTSGSTYYFELLYNTSFIGSQIASPNYFGLFNGTWLDTGLTATNSQIAGRLTPVNPNTAAVVPWATGVTNNIMMVGWSANLGTSWLTVSNVMANWNTGGGGATIIGNAFFGVSATGYINPSAVNPGAILFGTTENAYGLPINSLNTQLYVMPLEITPEPSTIVLAGLGGLSLLMLHRRK